MTKRIAEPDTYTIKLSESKRKLILLVGMEGGNCVRRLATYLQKSNSTTSEHIKKLEAMGILEVEKIGYFKIPRLTRLGQIAFKKITSEIPRRSDGIIHLTVVANNLRFKSKIVRKPSAWKLDNTWKFDTRMGWPRYRKRAESMSLVYTPKYLILYLDRIYADSPEKAFDMAIRMATELINFEMDSYPGLVIGSPKCIARTISQHYSFKGHPFAQWCVDNGIFFEDHKGRITIDSSETPELEFTNKEFSLDDAMAYMDHIYEIINSNSDSQKSDNHIKSGSQTKQELP